MRTISPQKEARCCTSQKRKGKQALSQLAHELKAMADAQMKRHKEAEKIRFEMRLKDKTEETEANCLHEIR